MRVRRFIYVVPASGTKLHRIYKSRYNPVEGDLTACRVPITTRWRKATFGDKVAHDRCAKCEKANVG